MRDFLAGNRDFRGRKPRGKLLNVAGSKIASSNTGKS